MTMKSISRFSLCLAVLASVCVATPARSVPGGGSHLHLIAPGETGKLLTWSALGESFSGIPTGFEIVSPPVHGTVAAEAGGLRYQPGDGLWRTGVDSFRYRAFTSSFEPIRTVLVHAGTYPVRERLDFEAGDFAGWSSNGFIQELTVAPSAALEGALGLLVEGGWGEPDEGAWIETANVSAARTNGGGQQGSGMGSTWRPPTSGGGGGLVISRAALYHVTTAGGSAWVELEPSGSDYAVRAVGDGGDATPWRILDDAVHRFELRVRDQAPVATSTAQLYLDGDLVGAFDVTAGPAEAFAHRIGTISRVSGARPEVSLDDITVLQGDLTHAVEHVIVDGFESGTVDGDWTLQGTHTLVSGGGALTGAYGLRHELGPGAPGGCLARDLPASADRFGARWQLAVDDTGSGPRGGGLSQPFEAEVLGTTGSGGAPLGVNLYWDGSSPDVELRLWAREVGGVVIPAAPVSVPVGQAHDGWTVDWRRATGSQAANGSARLWRDGVVVAELTGLDNSPYAVASYRFGALVVSGTGDLTVDLDELEAWTGAN